MQGHPQANRTRPATVIDGEPLIVTKGTQDRSKVSRLSEVPSIELEPLDDPGFELGKRAPRFDVTSGPLGKEREPASESKGGEQSLRGRNESPHEDQGEDEEPAKEHWEQLNQE
jgi:hypothetical protein